MRIKRIVLVGAIFLQVIIFNIVGQKKLFFVDERDQRSYEYVKIGNQFWMAENLAYLPEVTPYVIYNKDVACYYVSGYNGDDVKEAKNEFTYKKFGVYYNTAAATQGETLEKKAKTGIQGICPDGWHIPSKYEWHLLNDFLKETKGKDSIGVSLASKTDWFKNKKENTIGFNSKQNNSTGFNGLPGGLIDAGMGGGNHLWPGYYARWYTGKDNGQFAEIRHNNNRIVCASYLVHAGMNVRCVKDK